MTVIVVGAGIAGVACARELAGAGVDVRVRERSRVPGGRLASKRLHDRRVDLGAAYFTARDPEFTALVERWRTAGLARPWTDRLAVLAAPAGGGSPGAGAGASAAGDRQLVVPRWEDPPGPLRWAAPGGLRSLVEDLAAGLDIAHGEPVGSVGPGPVVDGERVDAVVLAVPDPQAERLLDPTSPAHAVVRDRAWNPVITVVAGFAQRCWPDLPAAFVNDHPALSLVADDGARRGDGAPVLVLHTTADLARTHDADPDGAITPALAALHDLLGIAEQPLWTHAHRWRFASPAQPREEPFHLGDDGIALAGDGWGRPRVETAWRSGTLLGRALAERLG